MAQASVNVAQLPARPGPSESAGSTGLDRAGRKAKKIRQCVNCREKRRKCDMKTPSCSRCERLGAICTWMTGDDARPAADRMVSNSSGEALSNTTSNDDDNSISSPSEMGASAMIVDAWVGPKGKGKRNLGTSRASDALVLAEGLRDHSIQRLPSSLQARDIFDGVIKAYLNTSGVFLAPNVYADALDFDLWYRFTSAPPDSMRLRFDSYEERESLCNSFNTLSAIALGLSSCPGDVARLLCMREVELCVHVARTILPGLLSDVDLPGHIMDAACRSLVNVSLSTINMRMPVPFRWSYYMGEVFQCMCNLVDNLSKMEGRRLQSSAGISLASIYHTTFFTQDVATTIAFIQRSAELSIEEVRGVDDIVIMHSALSTLTGANMMAASLLGEVELQADLVMVGNELPVLWPQLRAHYLAMFPRMVELLYLTAPSTTSVSEVSFVLARPRASLMMHIAWTSFRLDDAGLMSFEDTVSMATEGCLQLLSTLTDGATVFNNIAISDFLWGCRVLLGMSPEKLVDIAHRFSLESLSSNVLTGRGLDGYKTFSQLLELATNAQRKKKKTNPK